MSPQTHPHPLIVSPDVLSGCTCQGTHPLPGTTLYSGDDAAEVLAADCATALAGQDVYLLADPETSVVAGEAVRAALIRAGVQLSSRLLTTEPSATDKLAEEIQAETRTKALIISVGAGTINDLGKFAADRNGIAFWSMPTAPSMNGYTSSIAAIKVKGVKRTLPARPPQRLYVIPRVVEEAPLRLRQAGFCDVLAKVVSDIDWQCESLLFSNSYCALPSALLASVEKRYSEHPAEIGAGDAAAVEGLFKGLLYSGVAMSLAGSSAPASGGEHLVSHFWDMREPLTGRKPELHGLQVGIGIILASACYQRLAALQGTALQPRATAAFAETEAAITSVWGPYADEVRKQFYGKQKALLAFDHLLPSHWPTLQPLFAQVRSPGYFVDLFRRTGAPFSLAAQRLDREEFLLAARNSGAIRERITVLDFAAHAGVLEAAAQETLDLLS